VTLLDGFREATEAGTRGVQLCDGAVQPGLAIGHPALGPGLHPGQLAVAPRLGEGTDRDGDRGRGDPHDGPQDEGRKEHLPTWRQDDALHLSARAKIEMPFRE
jgi:hypothetical protein